MPRLSVRPLQTHDVDRIVRYFYDLSDVDVERMGIDKPAFPPESVMRTGLLETAQAAPGTGTACYRIWQVDDEAIGFSSLKDIVPGKHGGMHLHIWSPTSRGQGFGSILFCMSALEFYRLYELDEIVCEPCSKNPMPNRMLAKVGFPLIASFHGRSSALSAHTELNRYAIRRDIAERFLQCVPGFTS